MANKLLEAALNYRNMGWSVIPLAPGAKVPPKGFSPIPYRDKLATVEEVTGWWKENPNYNIGIITGKLSNLFVVDIDTEEGQKNIDQLLPDNLITPTATTPRDGQHLYFSYPEGNLTIGVGKIPGSDYRGEGGYIVAAPSMNGNGKGYEWTLSPFEVSPAMLPFALSSAYNNTNNNNIRECSKSVTNPENNTTEHYKHYNILQKGFRDDELFYCANQLIKGGRGEDFAKQVLEILANNCNPPFPQNEVQTKIDSALARVERKERNLAAEIREWVMLQEGYFFTTDIVQTLLLTTKEEKKNLTVILTRLQHEGLIEKYGERRGQYKTVQKLEENIIDLMSVDTAMLDIKFPFGIHELVKIMPKNIIVIAGESNSGKSAFLLNFAAKNMLDHQVTYFSSEMGGAELTERLKNFTDKLPFDLWKNCQFVERANDFDLAIRPEGINIIDFLEIHDDFYKVGGYIKKIFDKLTTGIAVIAIQKNKGRDEGLGGARSLEKARLYLSMKPGQIKIVKAKNWVSSIINPNGLVKDFKLAKGMIFKDDSGWDHDKE